MLPVWLGEVLRKQVNLPVCMNIPCQCGISLVLRWSAHGLRIAASHSAAALLEHISLRITAILMVQAKNLVSVEDVPSAPLRSPPGGRQISSHAYGFRFDGKLIWWTLETQPDTCYEWHWGPCVTRFGYCATQKNRSDKVAPRYTATSQ